MCMRLSGSLSNDRYCLPSPVRFHAVNAHDKLAFNYIVSYDRMSQLNINLASTVCYCYYISIVSIVYTVLQIIINELN